MPSYKLTYFDLRGRGQLSRYVFLAAGRDFEDEKIDKAEWASFKPNTPFGQLPVLEVDGKKLAESNAIARYLAREFDLAGKSNWEQALVDQYIELTEDMFKEARKVSMEKDETKKAELLKNLTDVVYPKFLGIFEKALEQNGGKYLVGDSLTLGDLALYSAFDTPILKHPELLDTYVNLKAHRALIEAIPAISDHVKNRKPTDI